MGNCMIYFESYFSIINIETSGTGFDSRDILIGIALKPLKLKNGLSKESSPF